MNVLRPATRSACLAAGTSRRCYCRHAGGVQPLLPALCIQAAAAACSTRLLAMKGVVGGGRRDTQAPPCWERGGSGTHQLWAWRMCGTRTMLLRGLGTRPSWIRLSARSRLPQHALAASATRSPSLAAVQEAMLHRQGETRLTVCNDSI